MRMRVRAGSFPAALAILAVNDDNEIAIAKAGGIPPLVALVRDGNDSQKHFAAGALGNLAYNADNRIPIEKAKREAGIFALAANPDMEGYHPGIFCDGSGQSPIVGTRFHRTGHDFDLCLAEFAKLPEAEKRQFEAIEPPAYRPKTGHAHGREGGGGEHGEGED